MFAGPTNRNVAAFWHMIWQEGVHCIVMATGLFENAVVGVCIFINTATKSFVNICEYVKMLGKSLSSPYIHKRVPFFKCKLIKDLFL